MNLGYMKFALAAVAALGLMMPQAANAGTAGKYQVTFVPQDAGLDGLIDIKMPVDRAGKLKVKQAGSDKDGLGGFTTQISGNGKLTCTNADSKGLCGPKPDGQPAVALATWTVFGAIEIVNASLLTITGGKIVYDATGKNKTSATGNIAASAIYNLPVMAGTFTISDLGSDPTNVSTGCDAGPTADKTTCAAGFPSLVAGFMFGYDATLSCTDDASCGIITLICGANSFCGIQQCSIPTDCNSGACNMGAGPSGGSCCDPGTSTDPDCDPGSPSGAFLDAVVF